MLICVCDTANEAARHTGLAVPISTRSRYRKRGGDTESENNTDRNGGISTNCLQGMSEV